MSSAKVDVDYARGKASRERVKRMIDELRNNWAVSEFEVRLGVYSGTFDPNVGRDFFETLRESLDGSQYVQRREQVVMHDFHFLHDGRNHRTRVIFDCAHMSCKTETVIKTRVDDVLLPPSGARNQRFSLRAQLSTEVPCSTDSLPCVVTPTSVRILNRFSFTVGAWRFDLTAVASGASRSEAETNLRLRKFTYIVECEIWDRAYVQRRSSAYVTESALLKLKDACPNMDWAWV